MTLPDSTALTERPLLLPSVRIEGFRAFRDLTIARLGRVNLVVGQNNVGKTTLLEALRLYAAGQNALWMLVDILEQRQERVRMDGLTPAAVDVELTRIFHEAGSSAPESQYRLVIGSGAPNGARLTVLMRQGYLGPPSTWGSPNHDKPPIRFPQTEDFSDKAQGELVLPILTIHTDRDSYDFAVPGIHAALARLPRTADVRARCKMIPAQSLASDEVGRLWDGIVLTDLEEEITAALRLIAPEIERISLTEDRGHAGKERIAMVRRKGRRTPEPLRSLGDGMNRIFEIALGLVNARAGLLLVDEIENGLHYSVQEGIWCFVFEVASKLGVQVFATTHSWDCIEAFQSAAGGHPQEGNLICLSRKGDDAIHASVLDEHDLAIATRESIEVR